MEDIILRGFVSTGTVSEGESYVKRSFDKDMNLKDMHDLGFTSLYDMYIKTSQLGKKSRKLASQNALSLQ